MSIIKVAGLAMLVSTGAAGAATVAGAETLERTVRVPYGDLDLASPDGVATLTGRIDRAATRACGPYEHRDLSQLGRYTDCVNLAKASAMARMQHAMATIHQGPQYAMLPPAAPAAH